MKISKIICNVFIILFLTLCMICLLWTYAGSFEMYPTVEAEGKVRIAAMLGTVIFGWLAVVCVIIKEKAGKEHLMKRKRKKRVSFFNNFEKWFIELVIGIIIVLLSTIMYVYGINYKRSFDKVEGIIISEHYIDTYSETRSGGRYLSTDRYYLYEVNYKIGGKEYYSDKYIDRKSDLKQNDSVAIKYRKDNPSELIDYRDTWEEGLLGIIGGIGFIYLAFKDRNG